MSHHPAKPMAHSPQASLTSSHEAIDSFKLRSQGATGQERSADAEIAVTKASKLGLLRIRNDSPDN